VASQRQGRRVIYAARFDAMDALMAFLADSCCRGAGGCLPTFDGRAGRPAPDPCRTPAAPPPPPNAWSKP